MTMSSTGESLESMLLKARRLLDWAAELGVSVGRGNWLEKSISRMEKILAETSDSKRRTLANELYEELVESQHNVSDLSHINFIHQHIGPQDAAILKAKLSHALGGANSTREERPTNTQPRDTLFELSVCARFNQRGYFAILCDPNPDIMAYKRRTHIAIECKRIFTAKSIDAHLNAAHKQLRDRPNSQKADMRVICIDITRAFTAGKLHIQGVRQAVIDELVVTLEAEGKRVERFMDDQKMYTVDAIILYFQDYIEPTDGNGYTIAALTQSLVIINPILKRSRRRKAAFDLRGLDPKGKITLTTKIVTR